MNKITRVEAEAYLDSVVSRIKDINDFNNRRFDEYGVSLCLGLYTSSIQIYEGIKLLADALGEELSCSDCDEYIRFRFEHHGVEVFELCTPEDVIDEGINMEEVRHESLRD